MFGKKENWLIIVFIIISGVFSIFLKNGMDWDFANYHLYNPWAFLHNRTGFDVAPAMVNTFQNPFYDLYLYFLIMTFNEQPNVYYFVMGVPFGILLWYFYKINRLVFTEEKNIFIRTVLSLMIGITGFSTIIQIGSPTNEVFNAAAVMYNLYVLLSEIQNKKQNIRQFIWVGLLLGGICGLKATIVVYCAAFFVVMIFYHRYWQRPWAVLICFCLGGLAGFLLTNGYWMYILWQNYGNPVMPFLNKIFKSEYFDSINFRDVRFLPNTWGEWLFYPLYWVYESLNLQHCVAEVYFFDIRFAVLELLLISWLIYFRRRFQLSFQTKFLVVWMLIAYVFWLGMFSIIRYALVLEMLGAVFIVKAVFYFRPRHLNVFYYSVLIIFLYVLVSVKVQSFDLGGGDSSKVIELEEVNLPDNSLLLMYNVPSAFIGPFWIKDKNIRMIGFEQYNGEMMVGSDFLERGKFRELRDQILSEHKGEKLILFRNLPSRGIYPDSKKYPFLKGLYCQEVENNLQPDLLFLCLRPSLAKTVFKSEKGEIIK